jgi:hypothetical protein
MPAASATTGLHVDRAQFRSDQEMSAFESSVLAELRAVTGMDLSFSSHALVAGSGVSGGSATARRVLNLVLSRPALFIDPPGTHTQPGGDVERADEVSFRGVWINVAPAAVRLRAFRPGIIMLHELAHIYAADLWPAGYDARMRDIIARGPAATADEQDEARWYRPRDGTGTGAAFHTDENVATMIERDMQRELGYARRTHYAVDIDYPPGQHMSVSQFEWDSGFLYLEMTTYRVFSSSQDLFAELARQGQPPTPDSSFTEVRPGTPAYDAVRSQLL